MSTDIDNSSAKAGLGANQAILKYFWDLTDLNEDNRKRAAEFLVIELLEEQKAFLAENFGDAVPSAPTVDVSAPKVKQLEQHLENCSPAIVYALRRLARGLQSGNKGARQGFATALALLLSQAQAAGISLVDAAGVLVLLDVCLDGASRGGEAKNIILGKVFGMGALVRSGLPMASPALLTTLNAALDAMSQKIYLREIALRVALDVLRRFDCETLLIATAADQPLGSLLRVSSPEGSSAEALVLALAAWPRLSTEARKACGLLPIGALPPSHEMVFACEDQAQNGEKKVALKGGDSSSKEEDVSQMTRHKKQKGAGVEVGGGEGNTTAAMDGSKAVAAPSDPSTAAAAPSLFSKAYLTSILPLLMQTSASVPRLHLLWKYLLPFLLPAYSLTKVRVASAVLAAKKKAGEEAKKNAEAAGNAEEEAGSKNTAGKNAKSRKKNAANKTSSSASSSSSGSSSSSVAAQAAVATAAETAGAVRSDLFATFWQVVVTQGLLQSSHDRKYVALHLLMEALPHLRAADVSVATNPLIVRTLLNNTRDPTSYLNVIARKVLNRLSSLIDQPCVDSEVKVVVVTALRTMTSFGLPKSFLKSVSSAAVVSLLNASQAAALSTTNAADGGASVMKAGGPMNMALRLVANMDLASIGRYVSRIMDDFVAGHLPHQATVAAASEMGDTAMEVDVAQAQGEKKKKKEEGKEEKVEKEGEDDEDEDVKKEKENLMANNRSQAAEHLAAIFKAPNVSEAQKSHILRFFAAQCLFKYDAAAVAKAAQEAKAKAKAVAAAAALNAPSTPASGKKAGKKGGANAINTNNPQAHKTTPLDVSAAPVLTLVPEEIEAAAASISATAVVSAASKEACLHRLFALYNHQVATAAQASVALAIAVKKLQDEEEDQKKKQETAAKTVAVVETEETAPSTPVSKKQKKSAETSATMTTPLSAVKKGVANATNSICSTPIAAAATTTTTASVKKEALSPASIAASEASKAASDAAKVLTDLANFIFESLKTPGVTPAFIANNENENEDTSSSTQSDKKDDTDVLMRDSNEKEDEEEEEEEEDEENAMVVLQLLRDIEIAVQNHLNASSSSSPVLPSASSASTAGAAAKAKAAAVAALPSCNYPALRALLNVLRLLVLHVLSNPASVDIGLALILRRVADEGLQVPGLPEVESEEEKEEEQEEEEGKEEEKKKKNASSSFWCDELVDFMMTVLARPGSTKVPIAPLRSAVESLWRATAENVTATGLDDIVRVIASSSSSGGRNGHDEGDVFESDEEEEEEEEESSDDEEDSEEEEDDNDDDDDDDEDEDEEAKKQDKKSKSLVGKKRKASSSIITEAEVEVEAEAVEAGGKKSLNKLSKGSDDPSDDESEGLADLDDEEMFKMDAKLAAVLRTTVDHRRSVHERKAALFNFRLRCLTLLEIFAAKKSPGSPILLPYLAPLLSTFLAAERTAANSMEAHAAASAANSNSNSSKNAGRNASVGSISHAKSNGDAMAIAARLKVLISERLTRGKAVLDLEAFPGGEEGYVAALKKALYVLSRERSEAVAAPAKAVYIALLRGANSDAGNSLEIASSSFKAALLDYLFKKKTQLNLAQLLAIARNVPHVALAPQCVEIVALAAAGHTLASSTTASLEKDQENTAASVSDSSASGTTKAYRRLQALTLLMELLRLAKPSIVDNVRERSQAASATHKKEKGKEEENLNGKVKGKYKGLKANNDTSSVREDASVATAAPTTPLPFSSHHSTFSESFAAAVAEHLPEVTRDAIVTAVLAAVGVEASIKVVEEINKDSMNPVATPSAFNNTSSKSPSSKKKKLNLAEGVSVSSSSSSSSTTTASTCTLSAATTTPATVTVSLLPIGSSSFDKKKDWRTKALAAANGIVAVFLKSAKEGQKKEEHLSNLRFTSIKVLEASLGSQNVKRLEAGLKAADEGIKKDAKSSQAAKALMKQLIDLCGFEC